MCDLHEERSEDSLNCIKTLLNDDYESANLHCQIRTEFTKDKWYSRNTIAGKLVSTQEQIQIVDHYVKLNLTRLVDSERMPYLEERLKEQKERIITNENTIEALAEATQEKIEKTEDLLQKLEIPISKNKTIHAGLLLEILIFVTAATIVTFIIVGISTQCFKRCRRQKAMRAYHIDTVSQRRRRLLNDKPSRDFFRSSKADRILEANILENRL
jgi:hypothetical protein